MLTEVTTIMKQTIKDIFLFIQGRLAIDFILNQAAIELFNELSVNKEWSEPVNEEKIISVINLVTSVDQRRNLKVLNKKYDKLILENKSRTSFPENTLKNALKLELSNLTWLKIKRYFE